MIAVLLVCFFQTHADLETWLEWCFHSLKEGNPNSFLKIQMNYKGKSDKREFLKFQTQLNGGGLVEVV
jgi:hypothetical protein